MAVPSLWDRFATIDNFILAWQRLINVSSRMLVDELGMMVFSFNLRENLEDLVAKVKSEEFPYQPLSDHKVYVPKPSSTMRTMSMMCIPDQVVYQALVNTVADASHHNLVSHENQHVWGNVYAGTGKPWMLKPWWHQYRRFARGIEKLYEAGSHWIASTDIVSFYDMIDHEMLGSLVKRYCGADDRFHNLFHDCLAKWASHSADQSMSRGIPQGSNASDYLANLYLYEIDRHMIVKGHQYLRYVDDIRMLGNSKALVQQGIIDFDLELKKYGLVAQVSKTSVHEITDINQEILRLRFWLTDPTTEQTYAHETALPRSEQASSLRDYLNTSRPEGPDTTDGLVEPDDESLPELDLPTVDETQERESVQNQLRELFLSSFEQLTQDNKAKETDSTITYCLNRLFRADEVRGQTLNLLELIPWRSEAVTKYLGLFEGDSVVAKTLTDFVDVPQVYYWHRANVLKALANVSGPKSVAVVCRRWMSDPSQDWYSKTVAAAILTKVPGQHAFFVECLRQEQETLESNGEERVIYRHHLAYAAFKTARSKKKHMVVFELMLREQESTLMRRLALYLLQQAECKVAWTDLSERHSAFKEYAELGKTLGISANIGRPCHIIQWLRQYFEVEFSVDDMHPYYGASYQKAVEHLSTAVKHFHLPTHNEFVSSFHQFAHITLVEFYNTALPSIGNPMAMDYSGLWKTSQFKALTPHGNATWEQLGSFRNRVEHPIDHTTRLLSESITYKEADMIKRKLKAALQELFDEWIKATPPPTTASIPPVSVTTVI